LLCVCVCSRETTIKQEGDPSFTVSTGTQMPVKKEKESEAMDPFLSEILRFRPVSDEAAAVVVPQPSPRQAVFQERVLGGFNAIAAGAGINALLYAATNMTPSPKPESDEKKEDICAAANPLTECQPAEDSVGTPNTNSSPPHSVRSDGCVFSDENDDDDDDDDDEEDGRTGAGEEEDDGEYDDDEDDDDEDEGDDVKKVNFSCTAKVEAAPPQTMIAFGGLGKKRPSTTEGVNKKKACPSNECDVKYIAERECDAVDNNSDYHWRKYGEKNSSFKNRKRSYYKCVFPSCPVRKVVVKDASNDCVIKVEHNGKNHNHEPGQFSVRKKKETLVKAESTVKRKSAPANMSTAAAPQKPATKSHPQPAHEQSVKVESMPVTIPPMASVAPFQRLQLPQQPQQQQQQQVQMQMPVQMPCYPPPAPAAATTLNGPNRQLPIPAPIQSTLQPAMAQAGPIPVTMIVPPRASPPPRPRPAAAVVPPPVPPAPAATAHAAMEMKTPKKTVPTKRRSSELKLSPDGFKWRKYGEKTVRGSSGDVRKHYFRCTVKNCEAKRFVVYNKTTQEIEESYCGEHTNHPAQLPPSPPGSSSS